MRYSTGVRTSTPACTCLTPLRCLGRVSVCVCVSPDELTRVTATDWLINVLRMGGKSLADEQSALLLRVVFRAVADPNATVVTNAIAVNHSAWWS